MSWAWQWNSLKHYENSLNSLKQPALTVHGLIFGRAYYWKDFCVWDLGGLFSGGLIFGGAYYRNFTVYYLLWSGPPAEYLKSAGILFCCRYWWSRDLALASVQFPWRWAFKSTSSAWYQNRVQEVKKALWKTLIINQSTNQPASQPINQSINQSSINFISSHTCIQKLYCYT